MLEHLVLIKVNPNTPTEKIEAMVEKLRAMKALVPMIRELSCGTNLSNRSQGFTHGLFIRFNSQADLDDYLSHPEHDRIVSEHLYPIVENVIVVDYEN